ncbi:hypothetical protein BLNAU_20334 [Blattamonas nauphoetae]|uniref:Uncharacterized protein n=1 Tax=Blattamonas nauphoetae TaxID=2049346 RepID=A0ABQ9WZM3_9EUKA|nr:hypothetical protein BLNAU_20334 [Blattamonas nauphoetae]
MPPPIIPHNVSSTNPLELLPPNEGNLETAESGLIETSPKIPTSSEPNTVEEQPVNPSTTDTNVDCPADIQQTSAQLVDPVPSIVQSFSENKPAPTRVPPPPVQQPQSLPVQIHSAPAVKAPRLSAKKNKNTKKQKPNQNYYSHNQSDDDEDESFDIEQSADDDLGYDDDDDDDYNDYDDDDDYD